MTTDDLAAILAATAAEHQLRWVSAMTETHTVTVSEPSIWDHVPVAAIRPPLYGFNVEAKEHDL